MRGVVSGPGYRAHRSISPLSPSPRRAVGRQRYLQRRRRALLSATALVPGPRRDLSDLRRAHRAHPVADVRQSRPDVPRRLAPIVSRTMDPVPDHRPAAARALAAELSAVAPGLQPRAMRYAVTAAAVPVVATGIGLIPPRVERIDSRRELASFGARRRATGSAAAGDRGAAAREPEPRAWQRRFRRWADR